MYCLGICSFLTHNNHRCWQRCLHCTHSTVGRLSFSRIEGWYVGWGRLDRRLKQTARLLNFQTCSRHRQRRLRIVSRKYFRNFIKMVSALKCSLAVAVMISLACSGTCFFLRVLKTGFVRKLTVFSFLQLMPSSAINANPCQLPSAAWNSRLTIPYWWIAPELDHRVICRISSHCVMPRAAWRRPWKVVSSL